MKYINQILLLVMICISASLLLAQECETKLIVETDFSETHFYLNDTLAGYGKKVEISITPGVHILNVVENSDRWDAKTFTDTIIIKKCDVLIRNYKLRSQILLQSEPDNAEVVVNDTIAGRTPFLLTYSSGNILLRKKDYEEKNIKLSGMATQDIINLDYIGTNNDESFFQKDIFKILIGSIIVLGGSSAYFKIKADDKFEEYQVTGVGELLDETRKYDLVSGILFGALQINFGVLIYYFMVE